VPGPSGPVHKIRVRTRFITVSGSACAGTVASTKPAPAGGPVPSQKSPPATTPQRPAAGFGDSEGGAQPIQAATPGTLPCGHAAAASVLMTTGHS
jgi:hypothetical protein